MAQSFNSQITNEPDKLRQDIEGLYWTVLYAIIRHEIMRDDSATDNFDCIDPVLLREMQNTEPRLDSTNRHGFFNDKLHFLNDTVIPYNYFLKVYVIQKKFRVYNISNQLKCQRKAELSSCVSQQFNGMYVVCTLYEMYRGKNCIPIYIFEDCPVTHDHYDNYCFSTCPKSTFITHYDSKSKMV